MTRSTFRLIERVLMHSDIAVSHSWAVIRTVQTSDSQPFAQQRYTLRQVKMGHLGRCPAQTWKMRVGLKGARPLCL